MTNRITQLAQADAPQESQEFLEIIKKGNGRIPNIFKVMSNSPALLESFLGISKGVGNIKLDKKIAEKIAIAIAVQNGCEYCLTAHSYSLGQMGESENEMLENRNKKSSDTKTQAALEFVSSLLKNAGKVSDEELENIRAEGFSDQEILDMIAVLTVNVLTTTLNNLAQTTIDFPKLKEPINK